MGFLAFFKVWNATRDIATFPVISSSYAITLVFKPGMAALGNAMLLLTPINCANLPDNCNTRAYHINPLHRSKIVPGSFPRSAIKVRLFISGFLMQYTYLINE